MRLIYKLLRGQFRAHKLRILLVLASLVTSVAMVLVVVGGQSVIAGGERNIPTRPLGRYDLDIRAGAPGDVEANQHRSGNLPPMPGFADETIRWLGSQPQVKQLLTYGEMKTESWVMGEMFSLAMYRPGQALRTTVMGTAAGDPPDELETGRWLNGSDDDQAVIDASIARRLGGVGSTFQITTVTGRYNLKIAGILHVSPTQTQPLPPPPPPDASGRPAGGPGAQRGMGFGFFSGGVYVSPALYEKLAGAPLKPNRALIVLNNADDEEALSDAMIAHTRSAGDPVLVRTTSQLIEEARNAPSMAQRGGGGGFFPLLKNAGMNLAILTAMFIIFNTFAMGVQERSRQLAMLRAIGMTRAQVVSLIALEGGVLALIGWVVGVLLGWTLLRIGVISGMTAESQSFIAPAEYWMLGAFTAFAATALAVLLPAWMAARKRPLEDMSTSPVDKPQSNWPWGLTIIALPLIALGPVTAYTTLFPEPARSTIFTPLSVVTVMVGFVLITPLIIVVFERLFTGVAGAALGLNPRLLGKRLSANLWQTVGSTTALMVGLGLYIIIQVWGQSMLSLFIVPANHPDAVVTVFPEGLPPEKLEQASQLPGVKAMLPMILEHPAIAGELPDVQFGGLFSRDVIYLGCDAQALLDPDTGMLAGHFVRGDPKRAYEMLQQGHACLITDSFYVKAPQHFDVGKTLTLTTVEPPLREIQCTIAGVVEMPGWHLLTKSANLRRGLGRTGGIIIVSRDTAKADFPDAQFQTLWYKLNAGVAPSTLEQPIIKIADPDAKLVETTAGSFRRGGRRGGGPPPTDANAAPTARGDATGGPATANTGTSDADAMPRRRGPRPGTGTSTPVLDSRYYARVTDISSMTAGIDRRAQGIIQSMTWYPLMALALASLAVVSTVMMSIRTRSWEMGILRSIGLTRGQLLRGVLAEGVLIGLLACTVSLCFGLLTSTASIAATSSAMGVTPTYMVPWKLIGLGLGAAMTVSIAACLWPAVVVARRQPLRLLQDGRSVE